VAGCQSVGDGEGRGLGVPGRAKVSRPASRARSCRFSNSWTSATLSSARRAWAAQSSLAKMTSESPGDRVARRRQVLEREVEEALLLPHDIAPVQLDEDLGIARGELEAAVERELHRDQRHAQVPAEEAVILQPARVARGGEEGGDGPEAARVPEGQHVSSPPVSARRPARSSVPRARTSPSRRRWPSRQRCRGRAGRPAEEPRRCKACFMAPFLTPPSAQPRVAGL
jgi:hypothetical protein